MVTLATFYRLGGARFLNRSLAQTTFSKTLSGAGATTRFRRMSLPGDGEAATLRAP